MVSVFQLPVVDPPVQEVEDGVRHQAEDVLNQRPHLRVPRFPVGVHRRGQLASLTPCTTHSAGTLTNQSNGSTPTQAQSGRTCSSPWQKSTRAASVLRRTLGSYIQTSSLLRVRPLSVHTFTPWSSSTCNYGAHSLLLLFI